MSEIRIPVDPMNPGQFFACCGLLDLLDASAGKVLARFEASAATPRSATFVLSSSNLSLDGLLTDLSAAVCMPLVSADKPVEASILPVQLAVGKYLFVADWWLNDFGDSSTDLKCWAGQVKSASLFSDLISLINPATPASELFSAFTMTKAKFGIDPRSAWNALDFGFSPNEHNKDAATYPLVEVLGSFGLQGFRPKSQRHTVEYSIWLSDLPAAIVRTAAFMPWSGLPHLDYEFSIAKRGQSYKYFSFATFTQQKIRRPDD